MIRLYLWLDRLVRSPYTLPVIAALVGLSLLLSVTAFTRYTRIQEERAEERERAAIAGCLSENELRADIADSGLAVESLVRSILAVVLRPGEGDADRQLQVRNIYVEFRPAFERYEALLADIEQPRDCRK